MIYKPHTHAATLNDLTTTKKTAWLVGGIDQLQRVPNERWSSPERYQHQLENHLRDTVRFLTATNDNNGAKNDNNGAKNAGNDNRLGKKKNKSPPREETLNMSVEDYIRTPAQISPPAARARLTEI
jgi:hypothetical protein